MVMTLTGCESIERVDLSRPLPTELSPAELYTTSKNGWELALADFYRDDWARMQEHSARFAELSQRWAELPKSAGTDPNMDDAKRQKLVEAVTGFAGASAELTKAVQQQNTDAATIALRNLGKRIADLEAINK